MNNGKPPIRRRQFLIKKLQIRYAGFIALTLMLFLILTEVEIFLIIKTFLNASHGSDVTMQVKMLQTILLLGGYIFIAIVVVVSIYLSHRIAGALYRIEKIVKYVSNSGDLKQRIVLRKNDELKELASILNEMFKNLDSKYCKNSDDNGENTK